jgi:dimethylglycine dehydrogenase
MVRPDLSDPGTELEVTVLGQAHAATVIPESPHDPANERLTS